MSDRDAFDDLLGNIDRPVAPRAQFAADLQKRVLAEFDSALPLPMNGDLPTMQPSIPLRELPLSPSAKRPARPIFTMAFEIAAALLLLLGAWQFAAHFFGSPDVSPGGANQPGLAAVTQPSIIQPATTVQPAAVIASPTVAAAAGPVAMDGGDAGRTGQQPGPAPTGQLTAQTIATGNYSRGGGPVAVLGDTIYRIAEVSKGATANGGERVDPRLEARGLATGETILWSVPIQAFGGPAIADGRVFVFVINPGGMSSGLEAYNADDGSFLWRVPMSSLSYGDFQSPIVANGIVYGAGQDGVAVAVDAATGKTIWKSTVAQTSDTLSEGTSQQSGGEFAVAGGHLYLFNAHGDLVALNLSDGSLAWSFSVAQRYGPITHLWLIATGNQVVITTVATSLSTDRSKVISMAKAMSVAASTGNPMWEVTLQAGFDGVSTLAIAGDKVVLGLSRVTLDFTRTAATTGTDTNDIEAYNLKDGAAAWVYKSDDDQLTPGDFAVVGTDVYFVGNQSKLYKLDATTGDVSVVFDNQGARLFSDSPVIVTGKIVLDSGNDPLVILSGDGATPAASS